MTRLRHHYEARKPHAGKPENLPAANENGVIRFVKNASGKAVRVRVHLVPKLGKAFAIQNERARSCTMYDLRELHGTAEDAVADGGVKTPIWYWSYGDVLMEGWKSIKNGQNVYQSPQNAYVPRDRVFDSKQEAYKDLVKRLEEKTREVKKETLEQEKNLCLAKRLLAKHTPKKRISKSK